MNTCHDNSKWYLLCAALLIALSINANADTMISPYTASYAVNRNGLHLANASFRLSASHDGIYTFQSESRPYGLLSFFRDDTLREISIFRMHDGEPQPLRYEYHHKHSDEDQTQKIIFNWSEGVATNSWRGLKKTIRLQAGMLDRLLAQLKLTLDLNDGSLAGGYPVINRGEVNIYKLMETGHQKIRVPAGTFETLKVERNDPDSKRVTTFWLVSKLQNLPVKMSQKEPHEATITFEMTSIHLGEDKSGK